MALDRPNDLSAFWMPYTANRQFKQAPRLLVSSKDMHYRSHDGREILDGTAGLWCCNAGHCRPKIVEAVRAQVGELDYAPAFQMGHPLAFELASAVRDMAPGPFEHVFFTNSGSESVDTALKIALAYNHARGEGQRTRFVGRERGYHGVNFGGMSVGGMPNNKRMFASLPGVTHIPATHLKENAFTRGQPAHGAHLADELERQAQIYGGETIAACIVEPVAGSAGVLVPPKGYLERLRAICDRHGILLIFDEVITGFGRLGAPFATDRFGVMPDLITCAKGITSGVIPMGAVLVPAKIHDAFMTGPEHVVEFFHGYTYSGNPVACAAGLATLAIYREEQLFERARAIEDYWADALHSLADCPYVIDVRNLGLVGAVELEPIAGAPTRRAFAAFLDAYEHGIMVRFTGDIIAMSPPLIIEKHHVDQLIGTLRDVLNRIA